MNTQREDMGSLLPFIAAIRAGPKLRAGFTDVELVPIHTREYYRDAETLKAFLRVVPILDHMPEASVLDGYISRNTYSGRVRLIRRFYGITARKPLP